MTDLQTLLVPVITSGMLYNIRHLSSSAERGCLTGGCEERIAATCLSLYPCSEL